ncbi:deoxycytidine triphosphate deaminase [marine actinobacterium PHSC20C1]|nr:deoxycytidine triphosphate deaminase [marine actinobacterium PHSC20C1]
MMTNGDARRQPARAITRGILAAATAALVSVSLVGCTPPVADAEPVEPTSSEPVETADPGVEPLVIPSCEQMLPESVAKEAFGPGTELLVLDDRGPSIDPWLLHSEGFDPLLDTVAQREQCIWGYPKSFHTFFTVMIAEISSTDVEALCTQLNASGYEATENGDVETYTHQEENADGYFSPTHFLVDDLWIYADPTRAEGSIQVGNALLEQVRTANPTRY